MIYNRFHRWSRQGVWFAIFEAQTDHSGIWGRVAIGAKQIQGHAAILKATVFGRVHPRGPRGGARLRHLNSLLASSACLIRRFKFPIHHTSKEYRNGANLRLGAFGRPPAPSCCSQISP
jgi:hypothetical protein